MDASGALLSKTQVGSQESDGAVTPSNFRRERGCATLCASELCKRGVAVTVFIYKVNSHELFEWLKSALKEAGYPSALGVQGGQGNVALVRVSYTAPVQKPHMNQPLYFDCDFDGKYYNTIYVTRNDPKAYHSEIQLLSKLQKRNLAKDKDIVFFTERAPCGHCKAQIESRSVQYEIDIEVLYVVNYTDTDEPYDPVMRRATRQSADEARRDVSVFRTKFK